MITSSSSPIHTNSFGQTRLDVLNAVSGPDVHMKWGSRRWCRLVASQHLFKLWVRGDKQPDTLTIYWLFRVGNQPSVCVFGLWEDMHTHYPEPSTQCQPVYRLLSTVNMHIGYIYCGRHCALHSCTVWTKHEQEQNWQMQHNDGSFFF